MVLGVFRRSNQLRITGVTCAKRCETYLSFAVLQWRQSSQNMADVGRNLQVLEDRKRRLPCSLRQVKGRLGGDYLNHAAAERMWEHVLWLISQQRSVHYQFQKDLLIKVTRSKDQQ